MPSIDLNRDKINFVGSKIPYDKQEFFSLGVSTNLSKNYGLSALGEVKANRDYWDLMREAAKNSETPEFAAEEKYAYARYDVSEGGFPAFFSQILIDQPGYQVLKLLLGEHRQLLATDDSGKVSPPSFDQLLKGLKGAIDGLSDYQKAKSKVKDSINNSMNSKNLKGFTGRGKLEVHLLDPQDYDFSANFPKSLDKLKDSKVDREKDNSESRTERSFREPTKGPNLNRFSGV